jgi:hypothetical protein
MLFTRKIVDTVNVSLETEERESLEKALDVLHKLALNCDRYYVSVDGNLNEDFDYFKFLVRSAHCHLGELVDLFDHSNDIHLINEFEDDGDDPEEEDEDEDSEENTEDSEDSEEESE